MFNWGNVGLRGALIARHRFWLDNLNSPLLQPNRIALTLLC